MNNKELSNILNLEKMTTINTFGAILLTVGMLTMLMIYHLTDGSWLSVTSGIFGVASVVFCSNRKVLFYVFGFVQLMTYVALCVEQRLYGEIIENIFYLVTMIYGIYHWSKHYNYDEVQVKTIHLSIGQKVLVFALMVLATLFMFNILLATDDTQPFMDAVTTVPAFFAQLLMINRYRDSWYYWLIIDVGSIIMWAVVGDWCMVTQFVFWTINCIYGLYMWRKA